MPRTPTDRPPEPLQIMPFTRFQLLGPHRGPTKAQFCKSTPNPSHAFWSLLILRGSGPSKIPKLHLWPSLNIEEQGDNQRIDNLYDRNLNAQIFQKVWCKLCSLSTKRSLPRRSGRSPLGILGSSCFTSISYLLVMWILGKDETESSVESFSPK